MNFQITAVYSCLAMAVLAVILMLSTAATAGVVDYECVVKDVTELDRSSGRLSSLRESPWIGSKFSVSRVGGEILGAILRTGLNERIIVDRGSSEYWFKHLTLIGRRGNQDATYLMIDEPSPNLEKAFVAITHLFVPVIVSGTCK